MVRVLANGEIDDGSTPNPQRVNTPSVPQQSRDQIGNRAQGNQPTSPADLFHYANQRLLDFGLPRFPVGDYILEPFHLLLALFSLVFFGPMALIAVCLIIYATQQPGVIENNPSEAATRTGQSSNPPRPNSNRSASKLFSGSGQRLDLLVGPVIYLLLLLYALRNLELYIKERNISSLPTGLAPFFQYASECNITQGIQFGMETLHNAGLPWASAIIASGLTLRLLTSPFHIYSEKLLASRIHAQNFFTTGILKKLSEHYKVDITPDFQNGRLELQTTNKKIVEHADKLLKENVPQYLSEHNLSASRIQNLKICTVPVWIFSSFALRNIISSDFHPQIPGILWLEDLLQPDPYFILPVAVGLFGFLNFWTQRKIYPVKITTWRTKSYDFLLGSFTLLAVIIMSQLPACIPLYWLIISMTGMAQSQLLRVAALKKSLGIKPLPTDISSFRNIFPQIRIN